MLEEYVHPDTVFLKINAPDRQTLFDQLADSLSARGNVNDSFKSFLNTREDNYPTGLQA